MPRSRYVPYLLDVSGCQIARTTHLRSVPILEHNGQLRPAAKLLLHAVSRVPMALLDACRVLPRNRNWLSFPWYSARSGGGAFVLGRRIYVSGNLLGMDRGSQQRLLFLLAHEVGHLPHAAGFMYTALGRTRFVIWSTLHYAGSYVQHGRSGYRKARIEQEAERGRWVLEQLLEARSKEPAGQELLNLVLNGKEHEVAEQIVLLSSTLQRLHAAYPGW